jgi:hypothetical protein
LGYQQFTMPMQLAFVAVFFGYRMGFLLPVWISWVNCNLFSSHCFISIVSCCTTQTYSVVERSLAYFSFQKAKVFRFLCRLDWTGDCNSTSYVLVLLTYYCHCGFVLN